MMNYKPFSYYFKIIRKLKKITNFLIYKKRKMKPIYKLVDWIPIDKIDWDYLCMNENDGAIQLLKNNINKINWEYLSENDGAIEILKNNVDKINWNSLSLNKNNGAIQILKDN